MRTLVSSLCGAAKVIPVVVIDEIESAVPLARTLVDNGLPVVEVTLRTEMALAAIKAIAEEVPDCILGVGSILTPDHLAAAQQAGGHFGVSPGTSPELLRALETSDWPFLPGAGTLSEMMTLRDAGFLEQKLFPASIVGGPALLKAVSGPISDLTFCPTGGVKPDNAADYFGAGNVFAVGGTWIAPRDEVREQKWDQIAQRAKEAANLG